MANVRALVHSTISTMLHNLKDGQVYISVDDVHQYLKNAGNTIAKETIQRTQCKDSVYEKVRHIVMKVRKPRYMSPMQQVMGNFLFANNCLAV